MRSWISQEANRSVTSNSEKDIGDQNRTHRASTFTESSSACFTTVKTCPRDARRLSQVRNIFKGISLYLLVPLCGNDSKHFTVLKFVGLSHSCSMSMSGYVRMPTSKLELGLSDANCSSKHRTSGFFGQAGGKLRIASDCKYVMSRHSELLRGYHQIL